MLVFIFVIFLTSPSLNYCYPTVCVCSSVCTRRTERKKRKNLTDRRTDRQRQRAAPQVKITDELSHGSTQDEEDGGFVLALAGFGFRRRVIPLMEALSPALDKGLPHRGACITKRNEDTGKV